MQPEDARIQTKTEQTVICGVLTAPSIMAEVLKYVKPEDFGIDSHRFMWEELTRLHEAGKDLSLLNLKRSCETRRISKKTMEGIAMSLGSLGMDRFGTISAGREMKQWSHIRLRSKLVDELQGNLAADNEAVTTILEKMIRLESLDGDQASWLRRGSRPMGDLQMASEMEEPKSEDVLVEPALLIRQGVTLLTGPSKAGKSFMVLELARALTSGTDFLSMYAVKGGPYRVAYVQGELSESQLYRRMAKMRLNNDKIALAKVRGSDFALNTELKHLGRSVSTGAERNLMKLADQVREKSIDCIIFDPLYCFLDGSELDEIAMKSAFSTLEALSEITNTAIILVHHNRKARPGDSHNGEMASGHSVLHREPVALMTVVGIQNPLLPASKTRLKMHFQLRCAEPIEDVEILSKDGKWWAAPWASDSKILVYNFVKDAMEPVKASQIAEGLKGQVGRSQVYTYLSKLVKANELQYSRPFYWVDDDQIGGRGGKSQEAQT